MELIYSEYRRFNRYLATRYTMSSVLYNISDIVSAVSHTSREGFYAIWKLFARDFPHKLHELI